MIQEYLTEQKKEREASSLPAMDATIGETVLEVIQLDHTEYLVLMESGCSVVFASAGSFTIQNKECTLKVLNNLKEALGGQAKSHHRATSALGILFQDDEEEEEDKKTTDSKKPN